jgi:hypothetical protein
MTEYFRGSSQSLKNKFRENNWKSLCPFPSRSLPINHSSVIQPTGVVAMSLNVPQNESRTNFSVMPNVRKISSFGKVVFKTLNTTDNCQNNNNHNYQEHNLFVPITVAARSKA